MGIYLEMVTVYKNDYISYDFIKYIISVMNIHYRAKLDARKNALWDEYLNAKYNPNNKRKLSVVNILASGFHNMRIIEFTDRFTIEINTSLSVPLHKELNLNKICREIDFGSVKMPGYHIITDTENYIVDNIDMIFSNYALGLRFSIEGG